MKRKPLPDDWQVTYQEPQEHGGVQLPGYTQVDKLDPGAPDSRESTDPRQLDAEGYESFSTRGLKSGRYRVRDLRARGLVGVRENLVGAAVDALLEAGEETLAEKFPQARAATTEERIWAERAGQQLTDTRGVPMGWNIVRGESAVLLVSKDGKLAVTFRNPDPRSGTEWLRTQILAGHYAVDHPYPGE